MNRRGCGGCRRGGRCGRRQTDRWIRCAADRGPHLRSARGVREERQHERPGHLREGGCRSGGVLGRNRRRAGVEPALGHDPRLAAARRQVVHRRKDQRQRQLRRPPRAGQPARQAGHRLGGRTRRSEDAHLRRVARRGPEVRQRAEAVGRRPWRPGGGVPADDPGAADRDARLRADRRGPQRRVRRLLGRIAARPDQRHAGQAARHRRRRLPAGRRRAAQGDLGRGARRGAERPERAAGQARGAGDALQGRPRPRPLVPRADVVGRRDVPAARERCRGSSVHPLHVGHHRQAEGDRAHHRRLPHGNLHHDEVGVRPQGGRHLLVQRRHRLGHRAQLPGVRPARQRSHLRHVRGGAGHAGPRPLLGHHRAPQGDHLLHGAHRHPRLHEVGPGSCRPGTT